MHEAASRAAAWLQISLELMVTVSRSGPVAIAAARFPDTPRVVTRIAVDVAAKPKSSAQAEKGGE
jgi:hypothetical protein